jgi:hypothetical protein
MLWSRVGPNFLRADDVGEVIARMRKFEEVPYSASMLDVKTIKPDPSLHAPPEWSDKHRPAAWGEVRYGTNFHEEIGVLFNRKIVDQDQLIRHFGTEIVMNFAMTWWWLHWQRENRTCPPRYREKELLDTQTEMYAEWERMVARIVERRPDLVRALEHDDRRRGLSDQVWIVCLPPDMQSPEWSRWEALALKLSRPLDRLEALERQLQIADGEPVAHDRTGRVLCVMPWVGHRARAERLQRLASRLASASLDELEALA